MNVDSIVLASSPAIGPLTMRTLADSLGSLGFDVATPPAPSALDRFVSVVRDHCPGGSFVLVGFSAAGPRLYAVADVTHPSAIVFMDARLPVADVAPDAESALAELLDRLPVDPEGLLPPWPQWWPTEVMTSLIPDDGLRARFVAECPRLERAMYGVPTPAPDYGGPCGYLAFGNGYADQRDLAAGRGWPVATLDDVGHLAPLVAPARVATALIDVIERL